MYDYKAVVTRVIDGDTFEVDCDLGFHITHHIKVRVLDLDTPEKFGTEKELGLICKQYAIKCLEGREVIIKTRKSDETEAGTDSFGRWLAYVAIDGMDGSSELTYFGVNKKSKNYSPENVYKLKETLQNVE